MTAPFAQRLAAARGLIARGVGPLPGHTIDQLEAAAADVRTMHDQLAVALPAIDPGRHWRQRIDNVPSDDVRATLLAAVLGCRPCIHLRKGGPQPAVVLLALRAVVCTRCSATVRRPPASEADLCDVCQRRGIAKFWPFAMRQGPTLVVGDCCADCALTLGIISQEAAS